MQKRLTARIQKLSKKIQTPARSFSSTLAIDPEDSVLVEKKGVLYAVFDMSSQTPFDPLLVTKIVQDVLHDSYYNSESVSPIQSLERAIVHVKDKIIELPDTSESTDFNILAAALWGNVLYMVQFGKGGSFLVRENAIKYVNSATEGNFSEASGVVRDGDVVILGTQSFIDSYTPQDLVSGAVSFTVSDLKDNASALIIKFESLMEFTEEEHIDFGDYKRMPVAEAAAKPSMSIASKMPRISIKSVGKGKFKLPSIIFIVVALLLAFSIFSSLKGKKDESSSESVPVVNTPPTEEVKSEITKLEDATSQDDEKNKVKRVDGQVFYDLKIVDENASPSSIAVLDNSVVVADSNSGKMFISNTATPKFEAQADLYSGISYLGYFGGDVFFKDKDGFKVYDGTKITENYTGDVGPLFPYLAFVYSVKDNTIMKFSKSGTALDGSVWATDDSVKGAVSMAVDGNIFLLKSDGSLLKFYSGVKEAFNISGLDKPLNNPVNIVKDVDLNNIYIADKGNGRVVVLDESGNLVAQYLPKSGFWGDLNGVSVSRDEKTLYILSGTKVYNFNID